MRDSRRVGTNVKIARARSEAERSRVPDEPLENSRIERPGRGAVTIITNYEMDAAGVARGLGLSPSAP